MSRATWRRPVAGAVVVLSALALTTGCARTVDGSG
jgi:hypothetical protein